MSKLFIVIVDEAGSRKAAYEKLKRSFDTAFMHRDAAILVAAQKAVSQEVAEAAGIGDGDDEVSGVVFRLGDGYSGYTARHLWEWLKDRDDE